MKSHYVLVLYSEQIIFLILLLLYLNQDNVLCIILWCLVSRKGEVCKLELSTANSECGLTEAPTGLIGY